MNLGGEKKTIDKEKCMLSTERALIQGWQQKNVATVIGKKSTVSKDFGTQNSTKISKRLITPNKNSVTMQTKTHWQKKHNGMRNGMHQPVRE
jgi:hypothetical protein